MSSSTPPWPVIGVVGGCGGAGASALCAALAGAGVRGRATTSGLPPPQGTAVLIDLDPLGGGIDVLLGAEASAGARWSGLHATGDRLDPTQLADGLPRWCGVPFLACDGPHAPSPDAVRSVVRAARRLGPVIIDLGRWPSATRSAALAETGTVFLLVPGQIRAVAAGAAQQASLDDAGYAGAQFVLARLDRPVIDPRRMAEVLGLDLAGSIGVDRALSGGRDRGIEPRRLSRATVRLAHDLVARAYDIAVAHDMAHDDTANDMAPAHDDTANDMAPAHDDIAPAHDDMAPAHDMARAHRIVGRRPGAAESGRPTASDEGVEHERRALR